MTDCANIKMLDSHRAFVSVSDAVQSYVNLADPGDLRFGYTRHARVLVDALPAGPVSAVHIGGAGMTIPRYVGFARPESTQVVFDPDNDLTSRVLDHLPLTCKGVRIVPRDGRAGLVTCDTKSADLFVLDAFANHQIPADLVTVEFFQRVRMLLRTSGYGLINAIDHPNANYVGRVCSSIAAADAGPVTIIGPRHQYFGNYSIVFGSSIDSSPLTDADPGYEVWPAARVTELVKSSTPLFDENSMFSPLPPTETLGEEWTEPAS